MARRRAERGKRSICDFSFIMLVSIPIVFSR